jgi:hypothetical protein
MSSEKYQVFSLDEIKLVAYTGIRETQGIIDMNPPAVPLYKSDSHATWAARPQSLDHATGVEGEAR